MPPGSQLPAAGSRGPVKTLSGPARRWREARTAGKVLRNQYCGRLAAGVQSKRLAAGRPGVGGKPARRGRFSEITIVARISPIFKTCARRRRPSVESSTGGGEGFQKSQYWPEFRLYSKVLFSEKKAPAGFFFSGKSLVLREEGSRRGFCFPAKVLFNRQWPG